MRKAAALLLLFCTLSGCGGCEGDGVTMVDAIIDVDPAAIDLGMVPIRVVGRTTLTVRNTGEAQLDFESIALDPGIFTLSSNPIETLSPSTSDVLIIEGSAEELGIYTTTLVIRSNALNSPTLRVPVRMQVIPTPPCDDGNICTTDWFDEESNACRHSYADGQMCEPADKCVINAVCSQGVCLGEPKLCDDQSMCTQNLCRQTDGECVFIDNETVCDDDNPCTTDSCAADGCTHAPLTNGTPCEDGDLCTELDSCFAGECIGSGMPDNSPCDDNDSCTDNDTCRAGVCSGVSKVDLASEGDVIFTYPLTEWEERAFLHRREVSLGDDGTFFGLDHLSLVNPAGLSHVIFAMKQCGTPVYEFAYRPPDSHVLVRYVRREMQLKPDNTLRVVVGIRQLPDVGYRPETTMYVLDRTGNVSFSAIQALGGETGRSLLPDGSHIYGVIWPLSEGPPDPMALQNLVIVREDASGNVLWRHERSASDWDEFLGVAGPRVLFYASGKFGALDFNTGATVWSQDRDSLEDEMALSTNLNLGIARTITQLIGVEILNGTQVFAFPEQIDFAYLPRTDPVISADGRIMVMMQRADAATGLPVALDWVELTADGTVLSTTELPYTFPVEWGQTRHEDRDDPFPTVADDGVAYVGYGDHFWAIDPGGQIRWTITSTVPNAFTGTVPLLRDDGVLLISEKSRAVIGVRTNGGVMDPSGWASFRHDGRRTNFTP